MSWGEEEPSTLCPVFPVLGDTLGLGTPNILNSAGAVKLTVGEVGVRRLPRAESGTQSEL